MCRIGDSSIEGFANDPSVSKFSKKRGKQETRGKKKEFNKGMFHNLHRNNQKSYRQMSILTTIHSFNSLVKEQIFIPLLIQTFRHNAGQQSKK